MALLDTDASFASNSIAKLLERLAYQINATLHSMGADNVHDLRVAIRRFEQSIVTFRSGLAGREVKRIRRKLKALMVRAGEVRDWDVSQRILAKCGVAGVGALKERLTEERRAAVPLLAGALRRWGARRSSSKWRAALLPVAPHEEFHPHLAKLARKFLGHGTAAASGRVSAEDLHELRIEGKKFRYTLELFQPLHGAAVREWLERLRPIQSILGDIHDCEMARATAERFDAAPEVVDWLKKRQRKKTREFRRLWDEAFASTPQIQRMVAALRQGPRKPMGRSTATPAAAVRQA